MSHLCLNLNMLVMVLPYHNAHGSESTNERNKGMAIHNTMLTNWPYPRLGFPHLARFLSVKLQDGTLTSIGNKENHFLNPAILLFQHSLVVHTKSTDQSYA
jgi:hypothetical protein